MTYHEKLAIVSLIMGAISAYLANKRGMNSLIWFGIGALLGLLGIFLLFFMPKPKQAPATRTQTRRENDITIDITPKVPSSQLTKFWYYLTKENGQEGPMSFDGLKRAHREGKVSDATYVWNEEMEEWKHFGELFQAPTPMSKTTS